MDECTKQRLQMSKEFRDCQSAFIALGDETRQQIVIALLEGERKGMRVGELTKRTHLSRPAVSHHLQILKGAKIINMHRKGTMNFYYMDANETEWGKIAALINHIYAIVQKAAQTDYQQGECDD
ncbi:transcriptional regulator, ArsR family [Anaerovirgula multivorans]|uniref:Transcriptional regulator, ArsR family n=1 Tax=Anaerovirgula multivorans TaxID=312168 RepID=A0A239ICB5_9FIRM|nr:metalloregulator ArsR/SmtB family transcription factor [Anaerovirgula multivorans]SNS91290.1 transcriptional regulator, ArsR family [Anaerovirgula multivorans]